MDVHLFATLRLKASRSNLRFDDAELDGLTVGDVIRRLDGELSLPVYDDLIEPDGRIRPGTMLLLDGKNVHHLNGLATPARGSRLDVFPPAGGG